MAATPPTAEELIEALHQKLRAQAPRRERKPGEAIEMGDDLECDIFIVVDGWVVPGSVKIGAKVEMREFLHLPGFIEQLLAMTTFSAKSFELELPEDYPVADLAGRTATFYTEVQRVFEVQQPELDDPAALEAAGLGQDIDQAMQVLAEEIDREQGEELLIHASRVVLAALADRVEEEIPEAAIDEELHQTWQHSDAVLLQRREFSEALVAKARDDFLQNQELREQARRRIKTGLALGAIVRSEKLGPSEDILNLLLDSAAEQIGISAGEAKLSLGHEPSAQQTAAYAALYQTVVEFVMSKAQVVFVPRSSLDGGS